MKASKKKDAEPGRDEGQNTTTALYLPKSQLALLRAAAFARMKERGGRPSVSAIISELVERHEKELAKEAAPFMAMFED